MYHHYCSFQYLNYYYCLNYDNVVELNAVVVVENVVVAVVENVDDEVSVVAAVENAGVVYNLIYS